MECVQHAAVRILRPGTVDYLDCWQDMQDFTESRTSFTRDEIWFLEHPPVITLGRNARAEHLLTPPATLRQLGIDLVESDRANDIKKQALSILHAEAMRSFSRGSKAAADFVEAYLKRERKA